MKVKKPDFILSLSLSEVSLKEFLLELSPFFFLTKLAEKDTRDDKAKLKGTKLKNSSN